MHNFVVNKWVKRVGMPLGALGLVITLTAGSCGGRDQPTAQQRDQGITEAYSQKLSAAVPYPLAAMNNSAERANLRARLLRLNDPNKIGYLYEMSNDGKVIAFFTIKGKPSSTGSQMTVTQNIAQFGQGGVGGAVTESMGDDGSYGPEECQSKGIFFFTADSDALVEWCGQWQYSDAPLKLTTAPLIVVDATAKPTTPVPAGGSATKP